MSSPHAENFTKLQHQAKLNIYMDALAKEWRGLDPQTKLKIFDTLTPQMQKKVATEWRFMARPCQVEPDTDEKWFLWLFVGGYGTGKTMAGSNWIIDCVKAGYRRPAIVGQTSHDVANTMIGGNSGVIESGRRNRVRAVHLPSRRHVTFPKFGSDVYATTYSADSIEQFKGPEHDCIWMDEQCKWQYPEAYEVLLTRARAGTHPKIFSSTTPERSPILDKQIPFMINARIEGSEVVIYNHRVNSSEDAFIWVTQGKTSDNTCLGKREIAIWKSQYSATRNAEWALEGRVLLDVPDALWTSQLIDNNFIDYPAIEDTQKFIEAYDIERVVVAVDPAVSTGDNADESGIVVCGMDSDGIGYVLEDISGKYSPVECCNKANNMFYKWNADLVVYEKNQGGDFVKETLRMVNPNLPVKDVWAAKGKRLRAEPIVSLYEQGRVKHVGRHELLERQMMAFTTDNRIIKSPDRVDALVYSLTELMLGSSCDGDIIWL